MNVKVVGLLPQKTMINSRRDEEQILLFILGWCSRQLSDIVNKTRHGGKVVRLDYLVMV